MPSGKHTSVVSDLRLTYRWLESIPELERLIQGSSCGVTHSREKGSVRFRGFCRGGVAVLAYSSKGITKVFLKTSHPELVRAKILEGYPE